MILLIISFFAGILTVLAPCILPVLPLILGATTVKGEEKGGIPKKYIIISSLLVSIVFFTLLLKASTIFISIPESVWKYISGIIIGGYGLTLLFPFLWETGFISKLNISANKVTSVGYRKKNIWGDILIGASLGPVFSTCSPTYFLILATVLPVSFVKGLVYLGAYALGLGLALLLISTLGEKLVQKTLPLANSRGGFKKAVGILMIFLSLAIVTGYDKKIETILVEKGFNTTSLEQKILSLKDTESLDKSIPEEKLIPKEEAPEFVSPQGYINTKGEKITLESLRGKVVLVEFWTYSCINCQRVIPHLNSWYEKYHNDGLEIVGIHTPEFAFEKVQENVEAAVAKEGIRYPVILDNDYHTWSAYKNSYWPRKYIINKEGYIVYDHVGEGAYEETEKVIQTLLQKTAPSQIDKTSDEKNFSQTPEIYFGYFRAEYIKNSIGKKGISSFNPQKGELSFGGKWDIQGEYAEARENATLTLPYSAKDVYAVLSSEKESIIKIKENGIEKQISIQGNSLFTLTENSTGVQSTLEISFPPGVRIYACTFG